MAKLDIIEKIPKLPVPTLGHSDVQVILRLVTILAACHLVNKTDKVMKKLDRFDEPNSIISLLK